MAFVDKYDYPIHSWSWWSVQNVRETVKIGSESSSPELSKLLPDTVLLGSSLMVVAMAEGDATWTGNRFDLTTYRKARYFDSVMADRWARPQSTINLAAPGQIVSDAYLTLKEALNEGLKPRRVIYGIAPRDFIDSTMQSPFETECYRYVSRLISADELEPFLRSDLASTLFRSISSALPLSRQALDLQMEFSKTVISWSDRALRNGSSVQAMSLEKRMLILSTYEPLDMVPGLIHAEVAHKEAIGKQYSDNLDDYKARYRKPSEQFFNGQMNCLSKLINLCDSNGIDLVLVNMPIRKCNIDLLDDVIYANYLNDVSKIVASSKLARYHDLCDFSLFKKEDYRDSVHLNGFGGIKFSTLLADAICETRQTPRLAANARKETR